MPIETQAEADRIWNLPKCERCEAMEERLKACLMANHTFVEGTQQRDARIRELESALLNALQGQRFIKG